MAKRIGFGRFLFGCNHHSVQNEVFCWRMHGGTRMATRMAGMEKNKLYHGRHKVDLESEKEFKSLVQASADGPEYSYCKKFLFCCQCYAVPFS